MDHRIESAINRQLLIAVAQIKQYASSLNEIGVVNAIARDDSGKAFVAELSSHMVSMCKKQTLSIKRDNAA